MHQIETRWSPPRATLAELAGQVRDVLADLPLFVISPFRRRRHQTWGAMPAEVAAPMPGDDLLPGAQYRATRAITIDAPPERVWPWLVQVGVGRAGWYASDLLDNFGKPSLWVIVPELQEQYVGQKLAMVPRSGERTEFVVDSYDHPTWLLWRSPNRTFAWRLTPLTGDRTRLVSRLQTVYEWRRPLTPLTVILMELADFPMMRRMLRNIRDRAESQDVSVASSRRRPAESEPGSADR